MEMCTLFKSISSFDLLFEPERCTQSRWRVSNFKFLLHKNFQMGQGDHMPSGGHRRKYDPKHAQKIIEGGKKADKIRQETNHHHKTVEEPAAEEKLLKDLKNL